MPLCASRAVVLLVVCCACAPAPTTTFEAFYQATTRKDVGAFRALLCPSALQSIANTDDVNLMAAFAVTRVVQRVSVREEDDHGAVLDIADATGQHTTVVLQRSPSARTWCVAGVEAPAPRMLGEPRP